MNDFAYSRQDAAGGFLFRGFRIQAEEIFCSGSAHQDPPDFAEIEFDAVQVFAAGDRPIENFLEFGGGEVRDGFFFLARLEIEVDAAVVVFTEF